MKELIDNAHCRAYSPQSHSERHTQTLGAALKMAVFFSSTVLSGSTEAAGKYKVGGGRGSASVQIVTSPLGPRVWLTAPSLPAVKRGFKHLRATLRDTGF